MKKRLSLRALLSITFMLTLLLSVTVSYLLIINNAAKSVKQNEENLLLATGKQLAEEPLVIQQLEKKETTNELQDYITRITTNYQLDFIVVMTMDTIRLTHPDTTQIGKHFKGGDEAEALKGNIHTSISHGTLGKSLRAFVPVYADTAKNEQIGVVALGVKMNSIAIMAKQTQRDYQIALVLSLLFSLFVAFCLSLYLKRILLNLEPQEIASILEERNAMLEETKDVIVVIDLEQHVLLANAQAQTLFQQTSQQTDLVGRHINELLYSFSDITLDKKTEQLYQQHGQDYLLSAAPVVVRGQKTGYVLFLRNATETIFAADQLANTTAYATALQSQSHEFMNKLHVIYGLVDLKAYEELDNYLESLLTPEKEFSRYLALLVKDPMIASFLIGERQKFAEMKTNLQIEFNSEIPLNKNKECVTQLITLYRYVHHVLLQRKLPSHLNLTIDWQKQQLSLTYDYSAIDIKEALNAFYFKQLLMENNGRIVFNENSFIIYTDYFKEEME